MSLSVETLAVARKYTDDSLAGVGAVAGVPCKIQSITAITGGNRVTFLWTDNNGDDHTSAMDVMNGVDGEDGKGIQSVTVNAQDHLIITYTDGTTVDAGQIEIHSAVDSVNGQTGAVVLDAEDVGALPDNTPIPSKTSDLTNDSGFVTTSDVSTALADYTTTADLTTLLAAKQDTLTFDNTPTENSNNPVKSGGVYAVNQILTNNVDVLFETGVKNICPPYSGSLSSNGITYIGNSDGTVTVNGTCSANVGANIRVYLKAGQYKVSGCPSGGSYSTYRIGVTTDSWTLVGTHDHGNGTTITIPSDGYYRINLDVREGYVANNLVFKPMITDVDTPESDYDHYVPYAKTNQQLTEDSVTWDNLSEVGAVNMIYPNNVSKDENGVTYTLNDDGTVVASGTPTGVSGFGWVTYNGENLVGKTLEFSCETTNAYPNAYFAVICRETAGGTNLLRKDVYLTDKKVKVVFTVPSNTKIIIANFNTNTNTTDNISTTLKPMITVASYNGDYVPYAKSNKELTEDVADTRVLIGSVTEHVSVTADGTKTIQTLMQELHSALSSLVASLNTDEVIYILGARSDGGTWFRPSNVELKYAKSSTVGNISMDSFTVTTGENCYHYSLTFSSTLATNTFRQMTVAQSGNTFVNRTSDVPSANSQLLLTYQIYKTIS